MSISLNVEPASIQVNATGGTVTMNLTNTGHERLAFKIKCNNNSLYMFKPVLGIIGMGQNRQVDVVRSYGSAGDSKLVINYLPAPLGVYDPKIPFAKSNTTPMTVTIPIKAVTQEINAPTPAEVANQTSYVGTLVPQAPM
ncbi:hypothetical protein QR680_006632 [Steinernema hermaphroditum]|uniref:Major sperm protein n=1 Tax=Steinernema hermaphroditum TaxID=289476 RepID=A0AA39HXM5_9BILA|nr:hypothetical protein QR680_006632 [Steinernema hermaphroditum]